MTTIVTTSGALKISGAGSLFLFSVVILQAHAHLQHVPEYRSYFKALVRGICFASTPTNTFFNCLINKSAELGNSKLYNDNTTPIAAHRQAAIPRPSHTKYRTTILLYGTTRADHTPRSSPSSSWAPTSPPSPSVGRHPARAGAGGDDRRRDRRVDEGLPAHDARTERIVGWLITFTLYTGLLAGKWEEIGAYDDDNNERYDAAALNNPVSLERFIKRRATHLAEIPTVMFLAVYTYLSKLYQLPHLPRIPSTSCTAPPAEPFTRSTHALAGETKPTMHFHAGTRVSPEGDLLRARTYLRHA
ncbi:hypothetical protein HYPSUDRAFT_209417 [Hypholoma sublateritium FD-334 SS-4]|uniref:Uncharacterized protein n=1 Tax=Hypholoma sublateritium (strain FD-334 SS-4) TaxID=945553 RepID=A0A0D2KGE5_HYPSF|nr:hypothetical protein HYPSUDRAFT_209417 [Hypholoma sublateritium FD-334 SS-4]